MFVHLDLAVVFHLFCIVQGLSTAAYLLAGPRRPGNRWLGLLLLALTLQVVDYFLSRSGVYYRSRWLYFTPLFFSWGFGPLLLSYVRALYGARPLRWPHFGPVAGQALFYAVLAVQSFDTKTWFWLNVHKPCTRYLEHYGAVLSVLVYAGLALRFLGRQPRSARWLRPGLLGVALFYVAAALDPVVNSAYLPAGAPKFYLTSLVLPVLAYALALVGWLKNSGTPDLHLTDAAPTEAEAARLEVEPAAPSPAAPGKEPLPVNPEQLARVVAAFEQEHVFRNPDLTLDSLAGLLDLTPNAVSQLLNAGLGQSFYELVNGYRLEEVKRRLLTADARRLTVLALALEAGFNSKTTFNRVFKEKTGLTPKEYQKKYQATHRDDSVAATG
ncbi:helix-turn-helix domain-containing protein [Hymenobacter metallilatus]|uniref:AraC family transcriptional regulator n=1 Tax=Hymenobacter metallilatus TaxID=2493666 RepID=A0A3R9NZX6_9BACT|nr:helix-turn-helix transcriptional regulator [Hymenobacter metallilatus]RSK25229.1 AraC family transcriptional regulator [Hymenobacter metallilatus]